LGLRLADVNIGTGGGRAIGAVTVEDVMVLPPAALLLVPRRIFAELAIGTLLVPSGTADPRARSCKKVAGQ
jgi:hypothetical protein